MTSDERFARLLMSEVRDMAIASCDSQLAPGGLSPVARRWAEAARSGGPDAIRTAIPDIVDDVLFHLLNAIDLGELPLALRAPDGSSESLDESGELAGLFMMTGGWRELSRERFHDDFAD